MINLLGGVALLLWGLRMVRTGVTRAYGSEIRRALGWSLGNRVKSFGTGLGVTIILQSSSATALLASSFAGRGLMATAPTLAILLGADVGTTIVAQVLSFDLSLLSPVLLFAGIILFMSSSSGRLRNTGRILIGLGQMLLALRLIASASEPMGQSAVAQYVLVSLEGEPILAILVACGIAFMAHSSLATVLLIISLVSTGALPMTAAFALVLGANLGGTLPPLLATIGSERETRRPLVGNFLFRLIGCAVCLPFLSMVEALMPLIEPDPARQIANFHTGFNLSLAALFLPFVGVMARVTSRVLPEQREEEKETGPRYLDKHALDTPPAALANATRETLRMGEFLETMLSDTLEALKRNEPGLIEHTRQMDDVVDNFYTAIKHYLTNLSREPLGEGDSRRCSEIITFTTNLEHVGDVIAVSLLDNIANKKLKNQVELSKADAADIENIHTRVRENLKLSMGTFMSENVELARQLLAQKAAFRDMHRQALDGHFTRLRQNQSEGGESSALYVDILRDFNQINTHLTSPAYSILEAAGELQNTRLKETVAQNSQTV